MKISYIFKIFLRFRKLETIFINIGGNALSATLSRYCYHRSYTQVYHNERLKVAGSDINRDYADLKSENGAGRFTTNGSRSSFQERRATFQNVVIF